MPIDSLRIEAVRGIREELTVPLKGKSLVVKGDNGTGKSSIVHALNWALTGRKPMEPADAKTSWKHVLSDTPPKVTITLQGGGTIEVTESSATSDKAGQALRAACLRANPFLLRKQLLSFLDDRPVERFRYLESFLDLDQADVAYNALSSRAKQFEGKARVQKQSLESQLATVHRDLVKLAPDGKEAWTKMVLFLLQRAGESGMDPRPSDWVALKAKTAALKPLLVGEHLAKRRVELDAVQEKLSSVAAMRIPQNPRPIFENLIKREQQGTQATLVDLLNNALAHVEKHSSEEVCPVCLQQISTSNLTLELRRRLDDLKEIANLKKNLHSASMEWTRRGSQLSTALNEATRTLGLVSYSDAPGAPAMPKHGSLVSTDTVDSSEDIAREDGDHLLAVESTAIEYATQRIQSELSALPQEGNVESLRELVTLVERTEQAELAIRLAGDQFDTAQRMAEDLDELANAVRRARQDVARDLLVQISELVKEYYAQIHPQEQEDDATGAPHIEVQRHAKGTAHVRGEFNKVQVDDPRLLYSDGHLDTVGICVFLALRRFRATRGSTGDSRLIVLDDVVLSIDLGHGRRLLDLLRTSFADHQVLIFTHNGLFFDWCIRHLPSYERLVINRWTLAGGPHLGNYPSAIERLRSSIQGEGVPKVLAQATMNLMDEWLAEARVVYAVSVPAKRGEEYTLTDIWEPFCKIFGRILKEWKAPIGNLQEVLANLKDDLPRMRNGLAAHENDFAKEFPLSGVREIATRCLALIATLYCARCSAFAPCMPSSRAAEMIRCSCDGVRYVRPSKDRTHE